MWCLQALGTCGSLRSGWSCGVLHHAASLCFCLSCRNFPSAAFRLPLPPRHLCLTVCCLFAHLIVHTARRSGCRGRVRSLRRRRLWSATARRPGHSSPPSPTARGRRRVWTRADLCWLRCVALAAPALVSLHLPACADEGVLMRPCRLGRACCFCLSCMRGQLASQHGPAPSGSQGRSGAHTYTPLSLAQPTLSMLAVPR